MLQWKRTLGQDEGGLSSSALLNLACGQICEPTHFLLSNYLGVGLMLTPCGQNLFQVFIQRMKNAFKSKIKFLLKNWKIPVSVSEYTLLYLQSIFWLLYTIEETVVALLRDRTDAEGRILSVQVQSTKSHIWGELWLSQSINRIMSLM